MKSLFVDTGFFLALEIKTDQNHAAAKHYWQKLKLTPVPMVTTTYVMDETVTFLNTRGWHDKAVNVGNRLLNSTAIQLVHIDEVFFQLAWAYFQQHADKTYLLTDCLSFIVMQHQGIQAALSFDKHFTQACFLRLPE